MVLTNFKTLNNRRKSPESIERRFEAVRSDYLKDLAKLRKKYAGALIELTVQYGDACTIQR